MTNEIFCKEIPCINSVDIFFHTSTLFKDYMITYGGYSMSSNEILSDIQILNLKTNCFEEFKLEGDEPLARYRHSACLVDQNQIFVFGGEGKASKIVPNDTAVITIQETLPLTLTYKKISTTGGDDLNKSNHSANIYQNKMYVFGGRSRGKPFASNNQLWSLDLDTFHWQICETTGEKPDERAAHSSVVKNHKLYIFGGYSDSKKSGISSCSVLSFETMQWENLEIKGRDFLPRYGASSLVLKDTFYITGGFYKSENTQNEVFIFNFEKNQLESLECKGDYIPVVGGTAVFYRNKIIIYGGLQNDFTSLSKISCLQPNQKGLKSFYEGANFSFSNYTDRLFSSEEFADIHFLVDGEKIPAHKLVLCLRCKYFEQLFKSGMKESNSSIIEITDVKLETFKALLQFLYQNGVELTESLALDLYVLSDKYMQQELMELCESHLAENVRLDNLIGLIDFVEKFGADSLKNAILECMIHHFDEIKQDQNNYPIPPAYIWEVAAKFRQKS